ncbi:MAG: glycosyltransferase family 2 protein [Saprospiraceae bacterium]|nr:glycosyltransferase family 2 protein [Saprospiraceae bacterium]
MSYTGLVSLIIPCHNEEKVIPETYRRIRALKDSFGLQLDLVFINDGSMDQTASILDHIAAADDSVTVLHFSRNFGHQPAISAGIHECKGDYAIILDADLQDPPEKIPDMLELALKENADVVYGVRLKRSGESWFKKTTAEIYYRLLNRISEVALPLDTGDFRLISRRVIEQFNGLKEKNKYIRGLVSWVGYKQIPFHYEREARFAGHTHFSWWKMISFALRGMTYFSKKPLQLATNIGLFCVFVGLGLVAYVLVSKYYYHQVVGGWSSLLITIVFFGGIQLLSIGLLGQYLGSIFDEVKGRPEYIVERKTSKK